jgi:hypothetical protein
MGGGRGGKSEASILYIFANILAQLPTLNANPDPYIDSTWGQTARQIKTIINFYTVMYI